VLSLTISDAGQGIPQNKLQLLSSSSGTGVGISGMRERLKQLGGDLEIQSGAGGTTLTAVLPIPRQVAAADHVM
jgi:signal transduction histidine kinase